MGANSKAEFYCLLLKNKIANGQRSTVDSRFLVELQPLIPLRIIKKLNKKLINLKPGNPRLFLCTRVPGSFSFKY